MGYYCMVDRPDHGKNNKPRYEHPTLEAAQTEAARLAKKAKSRVVILEAVQAVEPPSKA